MRIGLLSATIAPDAVGGRGSGAFLASLAFVADRNARGTAAVGRAARGVVETRLAGIGRRVAHAARTVAIDQTLDADGGHAALVTSGSRDAAPAVGPARRLVVDGKIVRVGGELDAG